MEIQLELKLEVLQYLEVKAPFGVGAVLDCYFLIHKLWRKLFF